MSFNNNNNNDNNDDDGGGGGGGIITWVVIHIDTPMRAIHIAILKVI